MSLIGSQTLNKANSNFTAIYIGIATYDDESIDQLIYSSENVMTHFARGIRQCSWFSTLMVNMKQTGNSPLTYETLKAADFLLSTWMRIKFPEVELSHNVLPESAFPTSKYGPLTRDVQGRQLWCPEDDNLNQIPGEPPVPLVPYGRAFQVAWCPNPGHNIIRESKLYVNDVPIETLDNTWLDLISQFRLPQGKIEQYQAMIGNVPAVTDWTTGGFFGAVDANGVDKKCTPKIEAFEVNVPQPFFYDRDSSTSFPLCAVTLNKVEIRVDLRNAQELLRYRVETYIRHRDSLQNICRNIAGQYVFIEVPVKQVSDNQISVVNVNQFLANPNNVGIATGNSGNNDIPQMWSRYAVVTKRERNAHSARGCKRDLLIEYVQKSDNSTDTNIKTGSASASDSQFKYEFIFNNPIRSLMYVAENVTAQENYHMWSNYSNNIELPGAGRDALKEVSFRVDNTIDMYQNVPTVFFTHVDPFYVAERIPNKVGYHALFYCLDLNSLEADGSWNYNKVKGYISYQYSDPEGYLVTGVYVDQCKAQTYAVNLNTESFPSGNPEQDEVFYNGFTLAVKDVTMRLKIRGLAWNIIRLQDNVLGFPLG